MNKLTFKMQLLSDVIIHADSATQGYQRTLDFIPGSTILGIMAKHYKEFDNAYDIFHNTRVRFGDAHISNADKKSFKSPLSWFFAKGEGIEDTKWVHHYLTAEKRDELTANDIQLEQARTGWIVPEDQNRGTNLLLNSNFAIKSAYDRNSRSSKDGQMFGFQSFEAGTEWIFYVHVDKRVDENVIIDKLTGEKHIGKSRSAQYGRVNIEQIDNTSQNFSTDELFKEKYLVIYAESRLVFFDKFGQPSLQPSAEDFNLDEQWEIDWSKTQTRYQIFAPYNFKNRSFLFDRVCFEKGSVFVFKSNKNLNYDKEKLLNGVGEFKNQGMGQIIVNPEFLTADIDSAESDFQIETRNSMETIFSIKEKDETDNSIMQWLDNREKEDTREQAVFQSIVDFTTSKKNEFSSISSSQWGKIRSIATGSSNFDTMMACFFDTADSSSDDGEIRSLDRAQAGFLEKGKMKKKWERGKDTLKKELESKSEYGTEYAVRLATQMQKISKNE